MYESNNNQQVTPPPQPVMINSSVQQPKMNRRTLFAVLAVSLLTIGTVSGFLIIARPVIFKSSAWDCGKYVFSMSKEGVVTVVNNSTRNEPLQRAEVYIDNTLVRTVDVPAVAIGGSATIATVQTPQTTFTWQVKGTTECSNAGRYEVASVSYQCKMIQATTSTNSALAASDLSTLQAGDTVRFVIVGTGVATDYTAARLTINNVLQAETTTRESTTNNLYQDYIIPDGTTSFSVSAQLKAVDGVWY